MATSNLRFRIIGDDDASGAFLRVAAAARLTKTTFDDINSSALGLTKMIGGAGLIPVLAGATAVLSELGTSMTAGALAGGVFGLSVAGIGKDMVDAQKKITELDTKLSGLTRGTDEYRQTAQQLHVAQQQFNADFGPAAKGLDAMKESWSRFKDATRDVTTGVMAKAFDLIASVLPKLVPVSNAAGKAIGGLIDDLSNWTKSPGFNAVIKWLKTSGPAAITHFGHAIGNIVSGLAGIFKNFVGPGDKAAGTLEKLTRRFAEWGHSKGVSDSVNKFLNYISQNGPNISSSLASLAQTLPKLASAAGGLGSLNLSVITAFLNLIAGMPQGVFNVVVDGIFGIVAASKALSVIMGINTLITGMQTAMTVLGDACIATRIQLGLLWAMEKTGAAVTAIVTAAQWALNAALTANPIGLVIVAVAALVAGLIIAYKKSETFRDIVNGAFHAVQVAVGFVVNFIKDHWKALLIALTGPTGAAIVLIVKNWDKVSAAIKAVGAVGKWLWNSIFQPVFKFIVQGVSAVLRMWANMLGALSHVPGFGWVGKIADGLKNAADKADALANGIRDIPTHKESTVVLNVVHNVVHTTGGHVPAFAKGTMSAPGGLAWVGEQGPELVNLPRGSQVIPAGRSARMAAGGGGGVTVVVHASGLVDPSSMARAIEAELAKLRRTRGGSELAFQ